MNCAYIEQSTGTILNIIVAEPTDTVSEGFTLVEIPSNLFVNVGFKYDGTNFIDFEGNVVMPNLQEVVEEVING